jgi:eukaryotic-like serine/threonine-protein kinase
MPLSAGTKLGPYEILAPIGAGGMGEVYRARDSRLERDVAIKVLPEHLSPRVQKLLRWCLEKDRKQRLASISDARRLLSDTNAAESAPPPLAPPRRRLEWVAWATAALFFLAAAALAFVHFREVPPEQRSVRFQVPPPEKSNIQDFRLSPDGRFLAFTAADRKLWVRALDSLQANSLPGTDGASAPFWSPDSQFIGFFAQGKLKKIAASGGPPQILCNALEARGGTWNRAGIILFAPTSNSGLLIVPAGGGAPVLVTSADSHRYPEFLPDGRHFLTRLSEATPSRSGFTQARSTGSPPSACCPTHRMPSAAAFSSGRSAPGRTPDQSGYLLFRRGDTLMAQPFDPAQLRKR